MSKDRSSNFELLRLLCIFGILMMHTFGGIDTSVSFLTQRSMYWLTPSSIWELPALSCSPVISASVLTSKTDPARPYDHLFHNIWYDRSWKSGYKSTDQILYSGNFKILLVYQLLLFPLLLTPFLNQIPEKLSKENFEKLLAVLLLLFSVIPTFGFFEIMQDGGKGLVHMVMIYLLGRYLALYHNHDHNTGRLFLGLFLSIGFIFLADSSLTFVRGKLYTTFCRDCSIFIIFGSVMVLLLFRELNFHSRFINRLCRKCARGLCVRWNGSDISVKMDRF